MKTFEIVFTDGYITHETASTIDSLISLLHIVYSHRTIAEIRSEW